ncbi:MAG: hypothetical protein PUE73_04440 [Eubacteriales bacterium]|nr:hypothetical protein [Eubacteriales bacterium]
MGKSKKTVLKRIGMISLILLSLYIIGTILFVSFFPRIYLANKYDTKMSDYKVYDYCPGNFHFDIDYWAVVWHDSYLVYEAKDDGRIFNVKFMNFRYYDAYQMNDVEQWLVEILQERIDENIDVVNIGANSVYGIYDQKNGHYKNVLWTKNNVDEILIREMINGIFIKDDNIEDYLENPNVLEITTYYNYGNTNAYFDEYIKDLNNKLYKNYQTRNIKIYLHKTELTMYDGNINCGVNLNELTELEKKYIIIANY